MTRKASQPSAYRASSPEVLSSEIPPGRKRRVPFNDERKADQSWLHQSDPHC